MKVLRVLLCAVVGSLLVVGAAPAKSADGDGECRKVDAVGVGIDNGDGTTTAVITKAGFLNGTTAAQFMITGGTPPALTFSGSVVFTAKHGTLTVGIAGIFNVATGAFNASGPVTGGTGKFAGATGTLTFSGVENFATLTFTETVQGQICLNDDDD